jgi:hypothetical protein
MVIITAADMPMTLLLLMLLTDLHWGWYSSRAIHPRCL